MKACPFAKANPALIQQYGKELDYSTQRAVVCDRERCAWWVKVEKGKEMCCVAWIAGLIDDLVTKVANLNG